jgi:signal transduction histidine kinase/DNA-binding NarL/FixJ family response regulator
LPSIRGNKGRADNERKRGGRVADRDLEILRLIDEGTAATTGAAFFRELVRRLADALDSRLAFVSQFCDDNLRVHVLALWNGEQLIENFDYPLKGTPCERVLGGDIVAINDDVASQFPADEEDLRKLGARAYLAIPLKNPAGRVLGHLAVISTQPKNWQERDFGILRIFAARATAEIERQNADKELVDANSELARRAALEGLITSISTRFVTLEAEDIDAAIETSLGEVAGFARSERARVFRMSDDEQRATVTHEWTAPGIEPTRHTAGQLLREEAPAVFDHFSHNQVLLVPRRDELPSSFEMLRELMRRQEVVSAAIVPMVYGNRPVGALAFQSLHHEQEWSQQDVRLLRLLGEIVAGAMYRKEQELQLRHRLSMEKLVAGISTRFMSTDPMRVEQEIDAALEKVGTLIGSDRGVIFRYVPDGSTAKLTNEWVAPGCASIRGVVPEMRREDVPEVLDHFLHQRTVNASLPMKLPPGFEKLNQLVYRQPVLSRIGVPIVLRNQTIGILAFHSVVQERLWPEEDIRLMGLLAEIIASAMARREAEIALERARDAAETASRAKSEFLASMSHELRTPLNGILGYAQLLRHDGSLAPGHGESIAAIERCGEHLLTLISDVLDLAKIEAGRLDLELTRFEIADFLRDVADIARVRAIQGGLDFAFETSGSLPESIVADQRKLRQVLLNLLGNAVKFTEQGAVRFRVRATPADGRRCHLRFEVEDTGVGIPGDELERIFDPFQQVRQTGRHVEGTGLGLSICRRLVQLMDGRLEVSSELGRCTLFRVEIDVEAAPVTESRGDRPSTRIVGYEGPRRRILIADDKADNRRILGQFVRSLGFDVDEAVNGSTALELAQRRAPDLVFMDLVMPVMDGFEAIRRLRADSDLSRVRIVALSASAFDTTRARSIRAGCDDFLSKPVRLNEVTDTLERELHLTWIRVDKSSERPATNLPQATPRTEASLDGLPIAVARELYELALVGDVRLFMHRVGELRSLDVSLTSAVDELEHLGRSFDMKGLRARLRPLVEAAS